MDNFSPINQQVAGIDIGSEELFVYVWQSRELRVFSSFTESVVQMANWLKELEVQSVAMEATGVLWLPIFEALERVGIEPVLVSSWHIKHVPGRKSDVQDCQWIAQLHHVGLLKAGFVPQATTRHLRTLMRLRKDHIGLKATHLQHMQKALDSMNLKLHKVISDLGGVSGMAIIRAIVAGKTDPQELAALCKARILKYKKEQVIASLQGQYHPAHIFALKQALDAWDFYQSKVIECDKEIEALLQQITKDKDCPKSIHPPKKSTKRNRPQIENLHQLLLTLTGGNDPTRIPGISHNNLLELISELGPNVDPWPTENQFTSWLGLAPTKHQSGKINRAYRYRKATRVGQIFRQAAESVAGGKYLALTGFYKRLKAKKGARHANKATARKIAIMYYRVIKYGIEYLEVGLEKYNQQYRKKQEQFLRKKAKELGFDLAPSETQKGRIPL